MSGFRSLAWAFLLAFVMCAGIVIVVYKELS